MTKEHFERWINDPGVALSELKEQIKKDPGAIQSWRMDNFLERAGIDPEGLDEVEQKLAAAEYLYNTDEGDELFFELFNDADKLSYPIYEANICGERSGESGSISMTRTKSQVVVFTVCDWGVDERDYSSVERFNLEAEIRSFIDTAEEYAAMDYPLVEESEAEEEYPDYIKFYSYMEWIKPEPKKYVETF